MRRAVPLILAVAALLAGARGEAQQPSVDSLKRGAAVRVLAVDGSQRSELQGAFERLSGDTLTVRVSPEHFQSMVLSSYHVMEVRIGRKRRTMEGLGIGALAGVMAGAAIGAIATSECADCGYNPTEVEKAVGGAMVFGVLGAGIGALVGASKGTETWAPVNRVPRVGLSLRAAPRVATFQAVLRF